MWNFAGASQAQQAASQSPDPESKWFVQNPAAVEDAAGKKQLFALMDKLELKLPSELKRKLIIISMKLATGWCSPYLAVEFEEEIGKLSAAERQQLEPEWREVRDHKVWPRMPRLKQDRPVT